MSRTQPYARGDCGAVIRRASAADLAALREFFAGLSMQTRYRRFFAAITPSPRMLRVLVGGAGDADAVVAVRGGVIIGHAIAVDRVGPGPARGTEIGVVVADAWQNHGLGAALVRSLIAAARARGVASITLEVLRGNRRVLAMITSHWPAARSDQHADGVVFEVPLPPMRREPGRDADPASAILRAGSATGQRAAYALR